MIKVVDKKTLDNGLYWYALQCDDLNELTGNKVAINGTNALITCAPGSIAFTAGGADKVQLSNTNAWMAMGGSGGGTGAVSSVNGKTGTVVLTHMDVAETVTTTTNTLLELEWGNTTVITGQVGDEASVMVSLPTPVAGKDCICGLTFKAGGNLQFTDSAPTGYTLVWSDEPTWTAGNVYEIIYRYLGVDGIISAKYAEVTVTAS